MINIYIKKEERSQISKLSLYLKELEKEEQTNPEVRRRKKKKRPEWNNERVEINESKNTCSESCNTATTYKRRDPPEYDNPCDLVWEQAKPSP